MYKNEITNSHEQWLDDRINDLFDFGINSQQYGGFGYLNSEGKIDKTKNMQTYITCRMTHIYSMYALENDFDEQLQDKVKLARELASHGVKSLINNVQDKKNKGFYEEICSYSDRSDSKFANISEQISNECAEYDLKTLPSEGGSRKVAYAHAFVLLAASSAVCAKIPRAEELFHNIVDVVNEYFWDDKCQKTIESYDEDWSNCEKYRGVNAAMHMTEAFLNTFCAVNAMPAISDINWFQRAESLVCFVFDLARNNSYMVPEHFDENWEPVWNYNVEDKRHQFRPYGATVGHAMEWARLGVQLVLTHYKHTGDIGNKYLNVLKDCVGLYNVALQTWGVDGKDGFVYTTDFKSNPIVRDRMHWVLCEAIGATIALKQAKSLLKKLSYNVDFMNLKYGVKYIKNSDYFNVENISDIKLGFLDVYDYWYRKFIKYADNYLITDDGRWNHQLDFSNNFSTTIWDGRPDIYHAYQALWFAKNNNIFLSNDFM